MRMILPAAFILTNSIQQEQLENYTKQKNYPKLRNPIWGLIDDPQYLLVYASVCIPN